MVSEERKEFAKMRRKMLCRTGSKQFICARCGLASSSLGIDGPWAKNEEMVDWFALQGPKIYKAWQEVGAI